MTSLSIPDINIWLALLFADHDHRSHALNWWDTDTSDVIALTRFTQLGLLRLLTTAAAMHGRPLAMPEAWVAYDRLFEDDRVAFLGEPSDLERRLRVAAVAPFASPKLWADAYLIAFSESCGATLVTFDRALAGRCKHSILLGGPT